MWIFFFENSLFLMYLIDNQSLSCFGIGFVFLFVIKNNHLNILGYEKFFVVLVWVMGLGLAALFAKDIVRGVKNVIAINHFTPVEVNNAPTGWHQDLCCYLN